jgi:anaerobic selenocysteine-containing dehydrogenase
MRKQYLWQEIGFRSLEHTRNIRSTLSFWASPGVLSGLSSADLLLKKRQQWRQQADRNRLSAIDPQVGDILTFGESIMLEQGPDYFRSRCILVCGANPLVSHLPRGIDILEAKQKHHAKLIVIDPRPGTAVLSPVST